MKRIFIVLLLITAIGCAKKYTKPADEGMTGEGQVQEEVMISPERVEEEVVEEMAPPREEIVEESTMATEERMKAVFKDVLFDYDRYDIRQDARSILNEVASFLNDNSDTNIVVEGHCDERGTNEYNLALGEKRAKAARDYLVSRGVSSERMIVITFGEEKPACTDQSESCWQKNRRAHFVIVKSRFGN